MTEKETVRLNKYLSAHGVCSRREADDWIAGGKITVDGRKASVGEKVTGEEDIRVNGKKINPQAPEHTYIALNKPRGIVCTTKNDKDNVIDFLHLPQRVFPVGRLDKDSEGLLLLTSDGEIVNGIMRAAAGHEKEYVVKVNRPVDASFIRKMSQGVYLDELKVTTRPCQVRQTGKDIFHITLTQGLNRQIRRMCDALGYRVVSLKRVRIMNIRLGDLASGAYREITGEEKKELERLLGDSDSRPGGRERRPQRPEEQVETGKGKRIWRTRSNGSES